jgi:hypothetical protein
MASDSPNRLKRKSSARGANTPSLPVTPQPSASTPLQPLGATYPSYLAINGTTSSYANSSRSSLGSLTPLLQRRQSTTSDGTPYTPAQNIGLRPNTPPVALQRPAPNQPEAGPSPAESIQMTSMQPPAAPQPAVVNQAAEGQATAAQSTSQLEMTQPAPEAVTPPTRSPPPAQMKWEEWKSWKIGWPWLSFLLSIVMSLIGVIAALDVVSRRNSGFVRQSNPPPFIAHSPALENAIWSQGVLYTAFPAFVMTVYRTMWESAVTAFADRQPYVDLKKGGGRPARTTIMLDYNAEPFIYGWLIAVQNKHFLLAACKLSSVVLALLVVPLTSFLFTPASFASNTTFPLSFETSFNSSILGEYPNYPDLRLQLGSAAAIRIQDASRPPWTDGEYAFAKFVPLLDVGDANVTLETTAYSAQSNCIYIPESQYRKTILTPGDTGIPALSIGITADDRGCQISSFINFRLTPEHPDTIIRIWTTMSCTADAGWSRFSILTALYTDASTSVTNFSLISCAPSYQITSGTLVATTDSLSVPSLRTFAPNPSNTSQFRPDAIWSFFETGIQTPLCYDTASNVDSNEFGQYVYKIASKNNPTTPLLPGTIMDAAQTLFTTTFAVFASTTLFKPTSSPANGTGIRSVQETRLIVVSPIAYIVLSVLIIVAILNMSLFFYARQESMLYEEPVGLLGMSGILHKSDVNELITRLAEKPGFKGKTTEAAMKEDKLHQRRYQFNEKEKRIVELGEL